MDENFLKCITREVKFSCGDLPYPPILVWEKNPEDLIVKSWQALAENIIKGETDNQINLYVHLPFCLSKCLYCTCVSFVNRDEKEYDKYLDALEKEARKMGQLIEPVPIASVYFGGGTPSLLSAKQLERLFKIVNENFDLHKKNQIAFESSAQTLTPDKIEVLKKYKIDRLTIGVQSLDEKILKINNRLQEKDLVYKVFNEARKQGIKYINIDIMAGIPGQSLSSFYNTLLKIIKLKPNMLHVNPFYPTLHTPFFHAGKRLSAKDLKKRSKMIILGKKMIKKAGYKELKNDSFGLDDKSGNVQIQMYTAREKNSSILGIGMGAISHVTGYLHYCNLNFENHPNWILEKKFPPFFSSYRDYLDKFLAGKKFDHWGYQMNKEEEMRNYLIHNVKVGLDKRGFKKIFGEDLNKMFAREIKILNSKNKLEETADFLRFNFNDNQNFNIYEKYFYSPEVLNRLKEIIKVNDKAYKDIDHDLDVYIEKYE